MRASEFNACAGVLALVGIIARVHFVLVESGSQTEEGITRAVATAGDTHSRHGARYKVNQTHTEAGCLRYIFYTHLTPVSMLDILCWVAVAVLGGISLLYACFELHYFMRMLLSVTVAKLFKKKVHILDTTSVTGVCLTTDIDTLLYHMNNARYIRELDFARVDFYERSDLYRVIRAKGGAVVQGACTIRYRRFLRPFTIFKIVSKIIYWDDKSIFMEHRFVTPRDEFVRAIAVCRQRVINANAEDVMKELLGRPRTPNAAENGTLSPIEKPELPLDVQKWVESNDISSANLRNGC